MAKIIRNIVRVVFFLYTVIVIGAFAIFCIDNPTNHAGGMYQGFAGAVATLVASFPWSLILIGVRFPNHFNESLMYIVLWLFAGLNIWLFYWLAFRKSGNAAQVQVGNIDYKNIFRDAAVIWITITLIDSLLQFFLTTASAGYQMFQTIQRVNMITTTILFCISHALARQGRSRHILLVAVCVSIANLVRTSMLSHSYHAESFFSLLWLQRYLYVEMLLGGLISQLFIVPRVPRPMQNPSAETPE